MPGPRASWMRRLLREHRVFAVALLLGVLVRAAVVVAFPPAFVFSDGPTYLGFVDDFYPHRDRVVGYGVLLEVLSWVTRGVWLVAVVQHLIGLATAVLLYALLRRWQVSGVVATLACLPVLLDGMQLSLEHSPLSDVVFMSLLVSSVAVLAWRGTAGPPSTAQAAVAGLMLAATALVRITGQPIVVAAVVFCLLAGVTWRRRLVTSSVLVATFVAPLAAYTVWYHASWGIYGFSESGGRSLYMRTTTFVECERLDLEAYLLPLCPEEPVGERQDPTQYGWHMPDRTHGLEPPEGVSIDQAHREFAMEAIREQPGDYVRAAARDFLMAFRSPRIDRYEYDTAWKWRLDEWVTYDPSEYMTDTYLSHGGTVLEPRQPWADAVAVYGAHVVVPGELLAVLLVLVVAGLVVPRRPGPDTRPLVFLLASLGVGLILVPDLAGQFVWRYQLPLILLVPPAAALAWTRLRPPG